MDEYVPLSRASDGTITTQFTMTTLEELGLLKMDFLGLRTLTVIQNAVRLAEKNYGVHLDMDKIDYNDKEVLESIGTGKDDGVFQLESSADEKLHEGAAARKPGGYHCGNFSLSSGTDGFHSALFERKE
ncbi:MAG: hypothetical protein ACLSE4_13890 [Clostridium sp.]